MLGKKRIMTLEEKKAVCQECGLYYSKLSEIPKPSHILAFCSVLSNKFTRTVITARAAAPLAERSTFTDFSPLMF
jgi:hypothetical protein